MFLSLCAIAKVGLLNVPLYPFMKTRTGPQSRVREKIGKKTVEQIRIWIQRWQCGVPEDRQKAPTTGRDVLEDPCVYVLALD